MSYSNLTFAILSFITLISHHSAASAQHTIAHRGVFHDVDDSSALPENSYHAVKRAYEMGLKGVELDLRLDADGEILVTHDLISNRTTLKDNLGAGMNAVDVALNLQETPASIEVSTFSASTWKDLQLKWYLRDGRMKSNNASSEQPLVADFTSIQSLRDMIALLKKYNAAILTDQGFIFILDIQDHRILKAAAAIIKEQGLTETFHLKFFASKGLASGYTYTGPETCYDYAKNNNLTGTKIITQINDGELDLYDNNDAGVYAFGKTLPIDTYLQCWADAQAQHADAPRLTIVSASVPAEDWNKTAGAFRAIYWAQANGRETMTIVPNPDAGRMISGVCQLFSFQSTKPSAVSFNNEARQAKANFAANSSVRPTYIIYDIMGDLAEKTWSSNYDYFVANLC